MVMYKWQVTVNGKDYEIYASRAETAVARCLRTYKISNPLAGKMKSEIRKTMRTEGTTYIDLLNHSPNYVISVRKLGVIYKGGFLK